MRAIRLPAEETSVPTARHFVAEVAGDLPDPDVVALVTSELVTNVIRHARTEVEVRVHPGLPLRVEVRDGAAPSETFRELLSAPPLPAAAGEQHGRGLAIVRSLVSRIGLEDLPGGGKIIWFELE